MAANEVGVYVGIAGQKTNIYGTGSMGQPVSKEEEAPRLLEVMKACIEEANIIVEEIGQLRARLTPVLRDVDTKIEVPRIPHPPLTSATSDACALLSRLHDARSMINNTSRSIDL